MAIKEFSMFIDDTDTSASLTGTGPSTISDSRINIYPKITSIISIFPT